MCAAGHTRAVNICQLITFQGASLTLPEHINPTSSFAPDQLLQAAQVNMLRILKFIAKPSKLAPRIKQLIFERILRRIIGSPQVAAKFYPYEGARRSYILPKVGHECPKNESDLPIPPQDLWLNYGKTPEEYLAWGRDQIRKMKDILEVSGLSLEQGSRVLDFGCASGIMVRWLHDF